jgi:hypothetical protein
MKIEEIAAECSDEREIAAMAGMQISERALRPLIAEKNENVVRAARRQIVK